MVLVQATVTPQALPLLPRNEVVVMVVVVTTGTDEVRACGGGSPSPGARPEGEGVTHGLLVRPCLQQLGVREHLEVGLRAAVPVETDPQLALLHWSLL